MIIFLENPLKMLQILVFSLIFCAFSSETPEYFLKNYTFRGDCPEELKNLDYFRCLPYINSSLRAIFLEFQQKNDCPALLSANFKEFSRFSLDFSSENGNFRANVREKVENNAILLEIPAEKLLSSEESARTREFLTEFAVSVPEFANSPHELREELRFIHNLLVHVGFSRDFRRDADLFCINAEISAPFLSFSLYETQNLLSSELSYAIEEREILEETYFFFEKVMNLAYSREIREKLFFGDEKLKLDDFVFAYLIARTRTFADKTRKIIYFLPFFSHLPLQNSVVSETFAEKFDGSKGTLAVIAKKRYFAGEELRNSGVFKRNRELFVYFGVVPRENAHHCIEMRVFEETLAENLKETQIQCISRVNFVKLKGWYVMETLRNIKNSREKNKCREFLQYLFSGNKDFSQFSLEEMVDGKYCPHLAWENFETFGKLREIAGGMIEKLKENEEIVEKYVEFRRNEGVWTKNAELLKEYYMRNREHLEELVGEIENYREFNREKNPVKEEL